ncbi:phosphoadenosine phosphosulfate reductase [Streptomyces sp. NPDC001407]|uniref:phosphoadenosine phosphosulfate reductase n=1 Tax=unclassified Streptomyces TaxID=2593676 RepID=UPI003690A17E
MRVVSYGGGVQSTALLVLAAQREIPYRTFLFANTGDDSEDPRTLNYVRHIAAGYAATRGIDLHILDRRKRYGELETLWGRMMRRDSRALPIPVRMSNGKPGKRSCTKDFKVQVIGKWLKFHGASADNPADVGIGISLDEIGRATNRHSEPYERIHYPLLELGLRRTDCIEIIRKAGLLVPNKSACFFCPFKSRNSWAKMHRDRPELFRKACHLEDMLNIRRRHDRKDPVFLTSTGRPLREAVTRAQDELPIDVGCDSGWCMT